MKCFVEKIISYFVSLFSWTLVMTQRGSALFKVFSADDSYISKGSHHSFFCSNVFVSFLFPDLSLHLALLVLGLSSWLMDLKYIFADDFSKGLMTVEEEQYLKVFLKILIRYRDSRNLPIFYLWVFQLSTWAED